MRRQLLLCGIILVLSQSPALALFSHDFNTDSRGVKILYSTVGFDFHVHTLWSNMEQFGIPDFDHAIAPSLEWFANFSNTTHRFICFTDHGEQTTRKHWNITDEFVKKHISMLHGFEWTLGGIESSDCCHVTVFNTQRYAATQPSPVDFGGDIVKSYPELVNWLEWNLGKDGVWGFPHPWAGKYQFDNFRLVHQKKARERCCWVEVCGGAKYHPIKDGYKYLCQAVQKGWHVGPAYGGDNFGKPKAQEPYTGVSFYLDGRQDKELIKFGISTRGLYASELPDARFSWRMGNSAFPDSEVQLGETYDVEKYQFPNEIDYTFNDKMHDDIACWKIILVYDNNVSIYSGSLDEHFTQVFNDIKEDLHRPKAIIFAFVSKNDKYILGAPIWLNYGTRSELP